MSQPPEQEQPARADQADRVEKRAELWPEEANAGSEDPQAQAEVILQESDDRTDHPAQTRHESQQTLGG